MGLTASGIGSGLDVNGIVSQLMTLERRPLDKLEALNTKLDAQLSAYGQLKSALSTFQSAMKGLSSADKFKVYSATPSDSTIFTATADTTAAVGTHSISVTTLAVAHSMASAGFADGTTSIGATGTLDITQGGTTFQVTVDGLSLNGIRDAINNSANNTGVTASVINTGTQSKLVLSAKDTGTSKAITIGGTADATLVMAQTVAAKDASLTIDGIAITSSSNVISTAITGVTLTLKKEAVSGTLDIARDTDAVKSSVQKFVDAYNELRKVMKTLSAEDATLEGDTGLMSVERRLQSVFNTSAVGLTYKHIAEIGIKTDPKTGDISLDSTKLTNALNSNFSAVADLFSHSTQGFAVRFESAASDMTSYKGVIESRKDGINSRIKYLDKSISDWEYRLERIENKYRTQFSTLDGLVSKLQSTGNYLTQQLASLPR